MVRCGVGGHGKFDDDAAAFGCSLVVVDSLFGGAKSLNAEIFFLGEALFFDGGSDDAAAGANVCGFCRRGA